MSWLRVDDRSCLDQRVGALTDSEYRARDALMQYVAREHYTTGIFALEQIVYAIYATPTGPRAVTRKNIEKLRQLDMVRARGDYSDDEIATLGLDWPNGDPRLRIHHWEKYNPPRDGIVNLDQRVTAYLTANPGASANDVTRAIPGHRAAVLAAVRRHHAGSNGHHDEEVLG